MCFWCCPGIFGITSWKGRRAFYAREESSCFRCQQSSLPELNTALIIGSEGQDGTYLCQLLRRQGYRSVGVGRRSGSATSADEFHCLDVRNRDQIANLIGSVQPDQLYYLAAFHGSSEDPVMASEDSVRNMVEVNTLGLNNVLVGVASASPRCRVFYGHRRWCLATRLARHKMKPHR